MAFTANITDQERKRLGGSVSSNISRYNSFETADRDGRYEGGWVLEYLKLSFPQC